MHSGSLDRFKKQIEKYGPTRRVSEGLLAGAYAGASIDSTQTSFLFTNSWMPMLLSSRPKPESLIPPNGKSGFVQVG